ncbi:MAG: hypothetical protein IH849_05205 [Acidobacteria bacterium]|nr:hypothetical protein [Acidobacteriota bacterium]
MTVQTQKTAPSEPTPINGDLLPALDQLFAETVALFQQLRAVAPLMHGHIELGRDECTVLQGLDHDGSRTVADIGNDCDIPRKQAQKLVKSLEKGGFAQLVANPENNRAKLVELTEDGRQLVRGLDRREVELLSSLPLATNAADLAAATRALADVRRALNDEAWRRQLEA